MKVFRINEKIDIVCDSKKTRNGFKHEATMLRGGYEQETVKINYLNRTWESYEFESVLLKLINNSKHLSPDEKETALKVVKRY